MIQFVESPSMRRGGPAARQIACELVSENEFDLPTLLIMVGTAVTEYAVEEFEPAAEFNGRAFNLTQVDSQQHYAVLVSAGSKNHHCDCGAFSFGRGLPCKHILALAKMIQTKTL